MAIWTKRYTSSRTLTIRGDPAETIYTSLTAFLVKLERRRSWTGTHRLDSWSLKPLGNSRWEVKLTVLRDHKKFEWLWREVEEWIANLDSSQPAKDS